MQLAPYIFAVAATATAVFLRELLGTWFALPPFITVYLAVTVSAWLGGWRPGLLATGLSATAAIVLWLPPLAGDAGAAVGVCLFVAFGVVIAVFGEVSLQTTRRERERRGDAERARADAQAVRERFESVLGTIGEGFTIVDREGRHAYVNRRAAEMFQRTVEQLTGDRMWALLPEARDTVAGRAIERVMETRLPESVEDYYPPLKLWIAADIYPADEGAAIVFRDITARKLAERALRESEQRLRLALHASGMGTWDLDLQTGEEVWSPELEAMFQLPAGGFARSRSASSGLVVPEDLPRVEAALERTLADGSEYAVEYRTRLADGSVRWILGRGGAVLEHGRVVRVTGVAMDVTDRKRDEETRAALLAAEQAAREEADAANRSKDEFLATLSHELRTPLNAIYGWARLLATGALDAAKQARAIEAIERNARMQARLVEDLLDLSRIASGKLRLELRPVDLARVVHGALEALLPTADVRSIRVEETTGQGSIGVRADPARLQQVVWNLVSNALKFTPPGGTVRVEAAAVNGQARLVVADSGAGIAPELIPHIFDRFRQGDSTSRRQHGGLGLGLAIVRHIVELHGGSVQVQSDGLGRGATFTVGLPLGPAAEPDVVSGAVREGLPSLPGVRVLIVEDNQDAREALEEVLLRHAAAVVPAGSVAEALAALAGALPHVIVSDIEMPEQDGYVLIERVRARAATAELPAVALTAYAGAAERARALAAGFDAHLVKPVDAGELVRTLAGLVAARAGT